MIELLSIQDQVRTGGTDGDVGKLGLTKCLS